MPIYFVDSAGALIGWGDTPGGDTPPAAPTGVGAVAGDSQVTVSWDPNTEPDIASYRVKRVSTGDIVATTTHPTVSAVITGLTNGVTYHLVVEAVDTAGNISADSAQVNVTPVPASPTKFGYNTKDGEAPLSSRLVKWGNRAPIVRRYNSNFLSSGTFNLTTGVYPERHAAYSVKGESSGSYTNAGLAAGNGNTRLTDWLESIPSVSVGQKPWKVDLCFHHEVNSGTGIEVPVATYLNVYDQFRTAIDNATLQSGVEVRLVTNFMAFMVGDGSTVGFDDSWIPDPSVCDLLTWDVYLNPGQNTTLVLTPNCPNAGGAEYGASFPTPAARNHDWMAATIRTGYANKWGIWEFNGPPRDWDGPSNPDYVCGSVKNLRYQGGRTAPGHDATHTEVERAAALVAHVEYMLSQPTIAGVGTMGIPDQFLFWENANGAQWNQKFFHDNVWDALAPYVVNSP